MKNKRKKIIIISTSLVLILFVIPFFTSIILYEINFSMRYETSELLKRDIKQYNGLMAEKVSFTSNKNQELSGYIYSKDNINAHGVIIISHGMGGGGHNAYMGVADFFTSNGYTVFAYDVTGNDESQGDDIEGVPQGVIDLDYAINFIKNNDEYNNLPIMLFGHSWGGYSVSNVLNFQKDISSVVMVSGFNNSSDMIKFEGQKMVGGIINVLIPYVSLYENLKFGEYATTNAINGFNTTKTKTLIIHSEDDDVVPYNPQFTMLYDEYKNDPNFKFISLKDKGHNYILNSYNSLNYIDDFNADFSKYVNSLDHEITVAERTNYISKNLDMNLFTELDNNLMNEILNFYNESFI